MQRLHFFFFVAIKWNLSSTFYTETESFLPHSSRYDVALLRLLRVELSIQA